MTKKTIIDHHVEEEESELFPAVRDTLGEDKLMDPGAKLKSEYAKINAE